MSLKKYKQAKNILIYIHVCTYIYSQQTQQKINYFFFFIKVFNNVIMRVNRKNIENIMTNSKLQLQTKSSLYIHMYMYM